EVGGDGETLQPVLVEDIPTGPRVLRLCEGALHLEVVAPAGEFEAVEAPRFRLLRERLQRQVRPLPREECDWPAHPPPAPFLCSTAHLSASGSRCRKHTAFGTPALR